jgi:hypothetical protein
MTKQSVVTIFLIIIGLFVAWYAYQEYKRYQKGPQIFIEAQ